MPSISELTNLSQRTTTPSINSGVASMGLAQPQNRAQTGDLDRLATDISKIVTGIEQYSQKKYDLSVDATERMAIDHKVSYLEEKAKITSNLDATVDERKQQLSALVSKYQDLSSSHIKDDVNLQNAYDDIFTNKIKPDFAETMGRLDIEQREKDLTSVMENVNRVASLGKNTTSEELTKLSQPAIKAGKTTEVAVMGVHLKNINNEFKNDVSQFESNSNLKFHSTLISKNKDGSVTLNKDAVGKLYNQYFSNYGKYENGKFTYANKLEGNETLKLQVHDEINKMVNSSQTEIDSHNTALAKSRSSEGINELLAKLDDIKDRTGKNGENLPIDDTSIEFIEQVKLHATESQKKQIDTRVKDIKNNNNARDVIHKTFNELFTEDVIGATQKFKDLITGAKLEDENGNLITVDSEFTNAEADSLYHKYDGVLMNIEDDNEFTAKFGNYLQKQITVDKLSPMVQTSKNLYASNIATTVTDPKKFMRLVTINNMYKQQQGTITNADTNTFAVTQRAYQQMLQKQKDDPKITDKEIMNTVRNTFNGSRTKLKDGNYTRQLEKYQTEIEAKAPSGFFAGFDPDVNELNSSVAPTFSKYLALNGIEVNNYEQYEKLFKNYVSRTEGFLMGTISSWNPFTASDKKASYVLRPTDTNLNDKEFKDGIDFIVQDVLEDDINNYTFDNGLDSNGNIYVKINRLNTNGEISDTYLLNGRMLKEGSYLSNSTTKEIKKLRDKWVNKLKGN